MVTQADLFGPAPAATEFKVEAGIVLDPAKPGPAGNLAANTTGIVMVRDALFRQTANLVEVEFYTGAGVFVLCITPQKAREFACAFARAADQVEPKAEAA